MTQSLIKYGARKDSTGWIGYYAIVRGHEKVFVETEAFLTRNEAISEAKKKAQYYQRKVAT